MACSIQPWLSVRNSKAALAFYREAFGAVDTYLLDTGGDNIIARLSIQGAEFWISDESPDLGNYSPQTLDGGTARMILITNNPEELFDQAIRVGATKVFPVSVAHGWKLGRIIDPFGHHWEIGHPVD